MSGHWKTWLLLSIALFQLSSNVIGDPLYTPPGSDPKRKELLLRRALNYEISQTTADDSNTEPKEKGELLYRVALQHLEAIDQSSAPSADDTRRIDNNNDDEHSILDTALASIRLVSQAISTLWTPHDEETHVVDVTDQLFEDEDHLRLAMTMLEKAGNTYGNDDALFLLAEINFFAKYKHPRDYKTAYKYYMDLAAVGNATAQEMIGFMYATGIGHAVERDQAQALLYHTFAAHGGDTAAEMTLGYRHLLGIGTEQKCEDAVYYYQRVAEKAIQHFLSGPPGGRTQPPPKVRLSDEAGGVYGYGASAMTDRRQRSTGAGSERSVSIDEVLQYWRYLAQTKGDFEAQLMLGQIYYQGTRSIAQDFKEAWSFFFQVADSLPSSITQAFINSKRGRAIGQAAGFLGKMCWRGEGGPVDVGAAYNWFVLGADLNDSISQNGLGMMYLHGIHVPQNRDKAIEYFKNAAAQDNPEAQVNLAIEYIKHDTTLTHAIRYFTLAAEAKHPLAQWYLAKLHQNGVGLPKQCQVAVSYYKSIAERCDWLHPVVETAYAAYEKGDRESALLYYMIAAEHGYEIAQSNVAYLLDNDKRLFNIKHLLGLEKTMERDRDAEEYALIYWSRSANQNNIDSRVKMGDYYFRGIGTEVDYEKAATCYRIAADIDLSPMAMWNLGWMYENGLGVTKDFHLAKRAYDNALSTNPDAYLPVKLSLIKLYLRYYWGWITRTETGQDLMYDDTRRASSNDGDGESGNVDGPGIAVDHEARRRKEIEAYEYERAHREIGAEEELRRKYSKHMKRLEREEDDMMDMGAGYDRDRYSDNEDDDDDEYSEEDELIESLMILGLCILVGWLVYMRQFRFGNNNNNNNNNPAADNTRDH